MNITTSAKGFAQMDITVEFPTVNESKEAMDSAIKALRDVLKENNIAEASPSTCRSPKKHTVTTPIVKREREPF
jgi:hypothetical protein